ncbi:hypothetical protein BZA05DRAFT_416175 [Tricharina praecox]|uniref:uncharacterized protein n=1 Tax=Tricharina praecox TaxID=43433 RepID=UPI00221F0F92|nr:uncharacterized protein BZA05DRAFT_416175 [Tricharina praecox]KAI5856508.1 hypothetical protein BZA05DRAFT_416175 [Tricharina praecox]
MSSSSIYSSQYGDSRNKLDDSAGDYSSTIIRRRASMRYHRETLSHLAAQGPARFEPRDLITPEPELDIFTPQDYEPPHNGGSTPSSYRRIKKTKSSAFTVAQIFTPPPPEIPSAVFTPEGEPARESPRKSASFLRGGTDFMGEGRARERRSYYMESAARKTMPPIVPPEVVAGKYKGKNEKGEWGAMRFRKKARKITDSVFGSVRKVLGRSCSGQDKASFGSIPEQQVASSRLHFREYVTAEEPPSPTKSEKSAKSPEKEKPKIRSNYVVSKAPVLHLVASQEMIQSDVGSISIASRMAGRTIRDGGDPEGDGEFFRIPSRRERFNVDARRVYSALLKRQNSVDKPALVEADEEPGYYITPGRGLLPEEEKIFERHVVPTPRSASVRSCSSKVTIKPEPVAQYEPEFEPESPPPPVPKIPKIWLDNATSPSDRRENTGTIRNRKSWAPSSTTQYVPINRNARPESLHAEFDHNDDASVSTSTDAALSACHLQVLRDRRFQSGVSSSSNENLRCSPLATKRFSYPEGAENILRSRSVLEQRHTNNRTPIERTRTPGYDRQFRAGLRSVDVNAAPIAGSETPPLILTKRDSRNSLSGRVSRMSVREFDVGLAVARQFGPVNEYPNYNNPHLYRGYANNGRRVSARVPDSEDESDDRAFL